MNTLRSRAAAIVLRDRNVLAARIWRFLRRHSPLEPSLGLRAARRFIRVRGRKVSGGPFEGMVFDRASVGYAQLIPKLLGIYELELHPLLTEVASGSYTRVVDLGCAEGYYAIGLARILPTVTVLAADVDASARWLTRRHAELNGVADRVEVVGRLDARRVADAVTGERALVICDIEGAEMELLAGANPVDFRSADLLVELHEFAAPGVTTLVSGSLASTHDVRIIPALRRAVADHEAELDAIPQYLWPAAVAENRPAGMAWAWCSARAREKPSH